jgi:predicted nucleic acid-binding protein
VSKREPERIYIDSCIAIELAKFVMHLHRPDRENDLWFVHQMLKASEEQTVELMTSSLTVVETLHLGKDGKGKTLECPPHIQEFLINLLTSGTLIKLVEPSLFVAQRARDLRWKHGLKLKPYDSMHVASALDSGCKEMLSWDQEMSKKRAEEIRVISELGLRVIGPHESRVLPDEYRQQALGLAPPTKKSIRPSVIQ